MNSNSLGTCNPIEKHGYTLTGEFTQLSNALARDGELSAEAFRVYVLLLSHDDGYRESAVKIADRFGWGKNRAKKALRELAEARLLVIQHHLTERGTRAFETYHVHTAGRFSDPEAARLSQPVGWSKSDQPGWSETDQGVGPNQTKDVGPNRTNKENQPEHQEKTNTETRYLSDQETRELFDRIQAQADDRSADLQCVPDYGDDAWSESGDYDE